MAVGWLVQMVILSEASRDGVDELTAKSSGSEKIRRASVRPRTPTSTSVDHTIDARCFNAT